MTQLNFIHTAAGLLTLAGAALLMYCFITGVIQFANKDQRTHRYIRLGMLALVASFIVLYIIFALYLQGIVDVTLLLLLAPLLFLGSVFVTLSYHLLNTLAAATGGDAEANVITAAHPEDSLFYDEAGFHRRLQEEFSRSKRFGLPLSVLLVQIDYLNRITDSYGHRTTLRFLNSFFHFLHTLMRDYDVIGPMAQPDLLGIILSDTNLDCARIVAGKLHGRIAANTFNLDDTGKIRTIGIHTTVSIGIACLDPDIKMYVDLMERADLALFKARDRGKNQIAVYGE